ncbi:MAG: DEAD/DEAH box helicase [Desulfotalea sp.]
MKSSIPKVTEYLSSLKGSSKFGPQVTYHKKIEAVNGLYDDIAQWLNYDLKNYLNSKQIKRLYQHQAESIESINNGDDVVVSTPTASGKTLIYNLPVLNSFISSKKMHALYLFPIKALARDQLSSLEEIFQSLSKENKKGFSNIASIYDGDTSQYQRQKIKNNTPPIILTNPEMIHLSFLPYHHNWHEFFSNLKYVIIDEVHTYRGVLGSHMSWVMRRLLRVAKSYGANPQIIMLSATIGNPAELGEGLIGRKVNVVCSHGAPVPEKNFVFLNPWDSAAFTACQLLEAAVKRGLRTIVYTQSRKMTELINVWTSPRLGDLASKLSSYRAGFLPEERRDIEAKLFSGDLLGVISTSALELGIDIGDLDICILVGYPGSIMATMQRGGRVGRSMRSSAIILIAQEDALDQYFMQNPDDFFSRPPESAVINPFNESIMEQHLHCLAAELELSHADEIMADSRVRNTISVLCEKAILLEKYDGKKWYATRKYPQRLVSLRGGGGELSIIDGVSGEIIGQADSVRAMKECHPEAIYLHRGVTWVVDSLSLEGKEVIARTGKPNYYTKPLIEKNTTIIEETDGSIISGCNAYLGKLKISEQVTGFQKIHKTNQKVLTIQPLELPKEEFTTEGLWFEIPDYIKIEMESKKLHFMGAIHALEHMLIALMPLYVLCDRNDIGGLSCSYHEQIDGAVIFIYDGHAGGVGLCKSAFSGLEYLFEQTENAISNCPCETGCPSCVHSPKCGSGNRPIDKEACLWLIKAIRSSGTIKSKENSLVEVARKPIKKMITPVTRKQIFPSRYGVFDLETKRSAEDVGGWHNISEMGMSLGVLYDSKLEEYVTYLEDEVDALVDHLCQLEMIVGFNNIRFDNQVLYGHGFTKHLQVPSLDILQVIKEKLGYRLSLDRLAKATLGCEKSADGLQALQWYKEGRIDLIQKYCKKDVEITKQVFDFALEHEHLLFVNKAQKKVRLPLNLKEAITALMLQT